MSTPSELRDSVRVPTPSCQDRASDGRYVGPMCWAATWSMEMVFVTAPGVWLMLCPVSQLYGWTWPLMRPWMCDRPVSTVNSSRSRSNGLCDAAREYFGPVSSGYHPY